MIGTEAERAGTIRRGARALAAVYQARVPWVLGARAQGLRRRRRGPRRRLAAEPALRVAVAATGARCRSRAGIEAAYRRELEAAEDPVALRAEIEARLNAVRSPFRTAERFSVEEIIDPRDTRPLLCDWAARAHELVALDAGHGPVARGTRP